MVTYSLTVHRREHCLKFCAASQKKFYNFRIIQHNIRFNYSLWLTKPEKHKFSFKKWWVIWFAGIENRVRYEIDEILTECNYSFIFTSTDFVKVFYLGVLFILCGVCSGLASSIFVVIKPCKMLIQWTICMLTVLRNHWNDLYFVQNTHIHTCNMEYTRHIHVLLYDSKRPQQPLNSFLSTSVSLSIRLHKPGDIFFRILNEVMLCQRKHFASR